MSKPLIRCIFSLYNVYQADQKVKNSFSDYGYKYFGKWTSRIEEEDFFKSLIKIRNDQREYLFIDLTRDGSKKIASIHGKIDSFNSEGFDGLLPSADSNTLVQKGKFIGDFGHFYLRPNQYHEHKTRVILLEKLVQELRYKMISDESISSLEKYNLKMLLDKNLVNGKNLEKLNCKVTYGKY